MIRKEPVYEYLVIFRPFSSDKKTYLSAQYFTEEEAKDYYKDMFVKLSELSKRERKDK